MESPMNSGISAISRFSLSTAPQVTAMRARNVRRMVGRSILSDMVNLFSRISLVAPAEDHGQVSIFSRE